MIRSRLGLMLLAGALGGCGEDASPRPRAEQTPPPQAEAAKPPERSASQPVAEGVPVAPNGPDSDDDQSRRLRDLLSGFLADAAQGKDFQPRIDDLFLKDARAWFCGVFDEDVGKILADSHDLRTAKFSLEVGRAFAMMAKHGMTEVRIQRISGPEDPRASERQKNALRKMVRPVDLFTANFSRPGEAPKRSMWSFALEGERFVLLAWLHEIDSK